LKDAAVIHFFGVLLSIFVAYGYIGTVGADASASLPIDTKIQNWCVSFYYREIQGWRPGKTSRGLVEAYERPALVLWLNCKAVKYEEFALVVKPVPMIRIVASPHTVKRPSGVKHEMWSVSGRRKMNTSIVAGAAPTAS
jgi:hypothetical protein